jgi:hypothetical protein
MNRSLARTRIIYTFLYHIVYNILILVVVVAVVVVLLLISIIQYYCY